MGMTPIDFFEGFVRENYKDSCENPTNVRLAFNTAVAASHMADQYFNYYKKHNTEKVKRFKPTGYENNIQQKNKEWFINFLNWIITETDNSFKDIRSISNAYKHLYTNPEPRGHSNISSTRAIEEIEFNQGELQRIEESKPGVKYTRIDGSEGSFQNTIKVVVEFWDNLLNQ